MKHFGFRPLHDMVRVRLFPLNTEYVSDGTLSSVRLVFTNVVYKAKTERECGVVVLSFKLCRDDTPSHIHWGATVSCL